MCVCVCVSELDLELNIEPLSYVYTPLQYTYMSPLLYTLVVAGRGTTHVGLAREVESALDDAEHGEDGFGAHNETHDQVNPHVLPRGRDGGGHARGSGAARVGLLPAAEAVAALEHIVVDDELGDEGEGEGVDDGARGKGGRGIGAYERGVGCEWAGMSVL